MQPMLELRVRAIQYKLVIYEQTKPCSFCEEINMSGDKGNDSVNML